jgi:hypothetical protein
VVDVARRTTAPVTSRTIVVQPRRNDTPQDHIGSATQARAKLAIAGHSRPRQFRRRGA